MNDVANADRGPHAAAAKWTVRRAEKPIVAKTDTVPAYQALAPYERPKAQPGQPVRFAVSVIAQPTGHQSKVGFIVGPGPSYSHFELACDEGTAMGGTDTAPAPLGYFTAGIAFCLLTHIASYLHTKKLDIDKLKVELRANFVTSRSHLEAAGGPQGSEGVETHVIIDSREPPEKLQELVELCDRACMAMQTVAHAVPHATRLVLNGRPV
jgi:uncharacterized OsmC-like protein